MNLKLLITLNLSLNSIKTNPNLGNNFLSAESYLILIKLLGTMTMTMTFVSQIMSDLHQTFRNYD